MSTAPPVTHLEMADGSIPCRQESAHLHKDTDPRKTTCYFCQGTNVFSMSILCERSRDYYKTLVDDEYHPLPNMEEAAIEAWETFDKQRSAILRYNKSAVS